MHGLQEIIRLNAVQQTKVDGHLAQARFSDRTRAIRAGKVERAIKAGKASRKS